MTMQVDQEAVNEMVEKIYESYLEKKGKIDEYRAYIEKVNEMPNNKGEISSDGSWKPSPEFEKWADDWPFPAITEVEEVFLSTLLKKLKPCQYRQVQMVLVGCKVDDTKTLVFGVPPGEAKDATPVGVAETPAEATEVLLQAGVGGWYGCQTPKFVQFVETAIGEVDAYFDFTPMEVKEEIKQKIREFKENLDKGIDRLVDAQEAQASGETVAWGVPGSIFYQQAKILSVCAETRTAEVYMQPMDLEDERGWYNTIVNIDGPGNCRLMRWKK